MSNTLGMPQMDIAGLSENWLFRHAGDGHWRALCAALDTPSASLTDEAGNRLYPTFVAIRGRYPRGLNAARENDPLDTALSIAHYGRPFFHSLVTVCAADHPCELEMLTSFVAREQADSNRLRRSVPAPHLTYRAPPMNEAPGLLRLSQGLRRGEIESLEVNRVSFAPTNDACLFQCQLEPSPYTDFNGAGLLYFPSYVSLADTAERAAARAGGLAARLAPGVDWALATSTIARDVYYYRNLDPGQVVSARVCRLEETAGRVVSHVRLLVDEAPMADVFTVKCRAGPAPNEGGQGPAR